MTPREVADAIRDEIGDWGVSQLGDGLNDAIHDVFEAYSAWEPELKAKFRNQVYEELYG